MVIGRLFGPIETCRRQRLLFSLMAWGEWNESTKSFFQWFFFIDFNWKLFDFFFNRRPTTQFTGWPSPATESFRPASVTEASAASPASPDGAAPATPRPTKATTTRRTTTPTTTTPRVTTVGLCGAQCRLAATVRLVDGVDWLPELTDHNTREFIELADQLKNEVPIASQFQRTWANSP